NEYLTYDLNPAEARERTDEGMELILKAWTEPQPFGWQGRHFQYRTVSIWPRPLQQPHPPTYALGTSREAGEFAARHHLGYGVSYGPFEVMAKATRYYREQCARYGWEPAPEQIVYRANMVLAETDDEADGFRIRYLEAGDGAPLVHLHGAGGPRLTPAHNLLSRHFRVVLFEMPGFGQSPENLRTTSMPELASTMAQAIGNLGLDTFNLMGTSFGGKTALWLALQAPERVRALVLEAPAAIRQEGAASPAGSP